MNGYIRRIIITVFGLCFLFYLPSCVSSKKVDGYANILDNVVKEARNYTGTRYKYGGMSKKGMDCSGLIYMSYKKVGQSIPRTAKLQSEVGKPVRPANLKKGDMVFFRKGKIGRRITHSGLVSYSRKGKVKFIHASSSRGVVEDDFYSKYWQQHFVKAKRLL